ncbi:MAG: D-alanine--D-alanine ligase family protein [Candidatus Sumerlaeaceae bacterium]
MLDNKERLKTIWVLCGGPSVEHEVSLSSAKVVCERIGLKNRRVRPVIVTRQCGWLIASRCLEDKSDRSWLNEFFGRAGAEWETRSVSIALALTRMLEDRVDCALLVFHGDYGEDGRIQGFLQTAGIPYTGSGILGSAIALNKAVAIATFARAGLQVARSIVVNRQNPLPAGLVELKLPLFTKPVHGGSSLGVTLVKNADELQGGVMHALEYDDEALIEEKIEGVEVSCGVLDLLEDGQIVTRAMPPTLISPTEAEFFDYDAKYVPGKSKDVTPAPLPPDVIESIQDYAMRAHKVLNCEGMSRTDMIVKQEAGSVPTILETQTIPGMTPTSLLPQQCAAVGIDFAKFLDHLITHAMHRAGRLN